MKKIFLGFLLFVLGIFGMQIFAQDLGGFDIENYNVHIDVQADGELEIEETISVNFFEDRHGIYRTIPYLYDNGEGGNYAINIYDISVDGYEYDTYKEGNNVVIKMGSPDFTINGEQEYIIHYKVYGGIKSFGDYQELYRNIIGSEWAASIKKASFEVSFPSPLKLSSGDRFTYYGYYGGTDSLPGVTRDDSTTLIGSTDRELGAYEAITVGVKLPSDYIILDLVKEHARVQATMFWVNKVVQNPLFYLTFLLPILLFLRFWNMWKKYGNDEHLTTVVDYDIPDGIDSALAGAIVNERCINRQLISLIYYWAVNGYVKIEQSEQKILIFDHTKYAIVKLKDLPADAPGYQRSLFHAMFASDDSFDPSNRNTTFALKLRSVSESLTKAFEEKLYTPESMRERKKTVVPMRILGGVSFLSLSFVGAAVIKGVVIWYAYLGPAILISLIVSIVFYCIMDKKSPEGRKIYSQIKGFKQFMKKVEEPKLKSFLKQDPNYFDKTLPLAVAFGLETKRTKKFEPLLNDKNYHNTRFYRNSLIHSSMLSGISSSMSAFGSGSAFGSSSGSGGGEGGSGGGGGGGGGGGR